MSTAMAMYWNFADPFTANWEAVHIRSGRKSKPERFRRWTLQSRRCRRLVGMERQAISSNVWQISRCTQMPEASSLPSTIHAVTNPGVSNVATVTFNRIRDRSILGIATISCFPPSGTNFPIGTNCRLLLPPDPSSNSTPVQSFAVIVQDKESAKKSFARIT